MEKEKSKNGNKKTALILVGVVDVLLLAALLLVLLMPQTSAKSVSPDLDPDFQANADSYGMEEYGIEYVSDATISYSGGSVTADETQGDEAASQTGADSEGMIFPDSDTQKITEAQMKEKLTDSETTRLAINEIYARHGYEFTDPEYSDYYNQFDWYKNTEKESDMNKVNAMFSAVEQENVDALQAYADANGWS